MRIVLLCSTMKQISVRQLRQHASVWLREVQAGESFEVTDRGRPVAMLVPRKLGVLDQMIADGRAKPATGNLEEFLALPPLTPKAGVPLPSEVLAQMRADERY
jgi:prevent-host-death family protein